ncbi:MAG: aminotransferase class III-fold pyridoxal phosphate-dependent enzyme [Gammaproteobacteria bacterium]|nr:aminotransferase class III-fold pyridoxal phosphate-dependent enzyme [Gammaproteobacteria bacterium]
MKMMDMLKELRAQGGEIVTKGLADDVIERFSKNDPLLAQAVEEAHGAFECVRQEYPDLIGKDEWDQVHALQDDYVNFYNDDVVNPYVPLAARGPWIVTLKGAVLHDNGGYGMLGLGHAPQVILNAMNQPHVMANIMTASFSQKRFAQAIRKEIGNQRKDGCPYDKFLCMNSGSEAVTVAARISDVNAKLATDPNGKHAGKTIKKVALTGAFHGRTDRPAQFSHSTRKTYASHLASYRGKDDLLTVIPNDVDDLKRVFKEAEANNVFIETMFMEPVMGEGNPGMGVTPEFYAAARELTKAHGSLLLMDAIQAGLRTTGYLSIVDYPGFEGLEAPDMETYSKALNAGQYPLSVLAMNQRAAELYRKGIYGNTMTANPRALDVGTAMLGAITPAMRENIQAKGKEFVEKLEKLAGELDGRITGVQGTGLLFSCELASNYKCYGEGSTEEYMRMQGVGVIHGGANSLRFTPHFNITSDEVDMIVEAVRHALLEGPRAKEHAAA